MVTLINTNPLGAVDVPLLRRTLAAGEEFEVDRKTADRLLEQVGNYAEKPEEKPAKKTTTAKKSAEDTEKTEG